MANQFCRSCGTNNLIDDYFCRSCGKPLSPGQQPPPVAHGT